MFESLYKHEDTPTPNRLALNYMEEKYGETFTYAAPCGNSLSGTRELLVTCNSFPDRQILVQIENFKSDNRIYRDNYLAVKYESETLEFFRSCASDFYEKCNVFYEAPTQVQSEKLTAESNFDAFLSDGLTTIVVLFELPANEFSDPAQVEHIISNICASCSNANVTVVIVEDQIWNTFSRTELADRISNDDFVALAKAYIRNSSTDVRWYGEGVANG